MGAAAAVPNLRPEFTAKGEPNYNFTKTPNGVTDELIAKGKLAPGIECWILLVIERHTWGADGKPEYLRASLADLARLCHVTPQALGDPLKRMEGAGIITWIPKGEIKAGEKRGYRLTPENWHKVKPYRDPNEVKEKPAKTDELPIGFDGDQSALVLMPGQNSRPVPVRIAIKGKPEFDFPVRYINEVKLCLAFAPVQTKTGLDIYVREGAADATNGEIQPDPTRRIKSERSSTTVSIDNIQVIENKQNGELLSIVVESRLESFRSAVAERLVREWGLDTLEKGFFKRIMRAAGPFLPVEEFIAHADRDLNYKKNRIGEGRNSRTKHDPQILIAYALQAATHWAEKSDQRQAFAQAHPDICPVCKGVNSGTANGTKNPCPACGGDGLSASGKAKNQSLPFDTTGDETAWPRIRKALRPQVSEESFQNWFERTRGEGVSVKGKLLLVMVPNAETASFLAEEYQELVNRTAQATDRSIERVQFRAAKSEASHG